MSAANILLIIAGVLGAFFFVAFFRLMAREPVQRTLLIESKPGKAVNLLVTPPLVLLLVFGAPQVQILAAAAIFPAMLIITWHQRRWLLTHGAKHGFVNRLSLVSAMGGLAFAAFASAIVLGA